MRITGEAAYVLHARPWRETSLLVEVLADQQGRMGLIARGVQGPKRHVLRAALQPMQHIRLDAVLRGELAQLRGAEALDAAPLLQGDAALAAFYVNELVLRLAPRGDALPELFDAYGEVRTHLASDAPLAWTLRRFERDLLEALGFGLVLDADTDGTPLDPAARYRLDPEQGARRVRHDRGQTDRDMAATGSALLALAGDVQPESDDLASLRRTMREVLAYHLGARGLKSWEMLAELGRLSKPR